MDSLKKQYFADKLVSWFRSHHRDLPWRKTKDPYCIWVSEIMLQQTRVDTVIPYYETFLARFPTIQALAEAPEEDLLKVWEGLGYYSRVRNMQIAARTILEEYGGVMPDTREAISKLRGIGPYTAGAILSIAFGKPEPAVDGNVLRVISRYFLLYDDIAKAGTRVKVERLIAEFIPEDAASDFNQALMELGALICTPRSAKCDACPVAGHCSARHEGAVDELPVKTKAKRPRYEERAAYIIEGTGDREGQIMLRKRPQDGLLARMWELPNELLSFDAQEQFGLTDRYLMDAEHVFSHIRWQMKVYTCKDIEADTVIGKSVDMQAVSMDPKRSATDAMQTDRRKATSRDSRLSVMETAASYETDTQGTQSGSGGAGAGTDDEEILWVSKDNWNEQALPNVFLRILKHYFSR